MYKYTLPAHAQVLDSRTGQPVPVADLYRNFHGTYALDGVSSNYTLTRGVVAEIKEAEMSLPLMRVLFNSGRSVDLPAANLLQFEGSSAIGPGARAGIARRLLLPLLLEEQEDSALILLAHLTGDGCTLARHAIGYTSEDPANLDIVEKSARELFNVGTIRYPYKTGTWTNMSLTRPAGSKQHPIANWYKSLGIWNLRSYEKHLPSGLFSLSTSQIALFLRHLWATDGSFTTHLDPRGSTAVNCYYATSSPQLARDVEHLLLRMSIVGRTTTVSYKKSARPGYHIDVSGSEDQLKFVTDIGIHGLRGVKAEAAKEFLEQKIQNTNVDTFPAEIWPIIQAEADRLRLSTREFNRCVYGKNVKGSISKKSYCPSRTHLAQIGKSLGSRQLSGFADGDVQWDTVRSVTTVAQKETCFELITADLPSLLVNTVAVKGKVI